MKRKVHTGDRLTRVALAALQPEASIQAAICDLLDLHHVVYSVTDASRVWGPDGRPRKSKVKPAWPDITACLWGGQFWAIETKRAKGGRVSAVQQRVHAEIIVAGGRVTVARSVDDVMAVLRNDVR